MIPALLLVAAGLAALFYGAEWLVKGAVRLANSYGVPALVIGLTLVAFGTSMPEMLVSVTAALRGSSEIALGNVVGSNIANIGLILGLTGLIFPITVHSQVLRREIPLMIAISLLTYAFAWDGEIARWEGVLLFIGILLFTALSYLVSQRETTEAATVEEIEQFEEREGIMGEGQVNRLLEIGRVLLGIALLSVGAQWLISGATTIAEAAGISDLVIGLTLVALGTSLPELSTSLVSAFRREADISVGNIVGSNIFNLLGVLGLTAALRPVPVSPIVTRIDLPVMLAISIVLWPLLMDSKLSRWQGALLFIAYLVFTIYLFGR